MTTQYRDLQSAYHQLLRDAIARKKKITDDCYRLRIDSLYCQAKHRLDLDAMLLDQLTNIRNRQN